MKDYYKNRSNNNNDNSKYYNIYFQCLVANGKAVAVAIVVPRPEVTVAW